ncbi:MAG: hypothetical protein M0R18_08710, partial [Deltaproteobacteria bacterium]|nr:hypothetical protein [Deltaproteobacteria bacterium]
MAAGCTTTAVRSFAAGLPSSMVATFLIRLSGRERSRKIRPPIRKINGALPSRPAGAAEAPGTMRPGRRAPAIFPHLHLKGPCADMVML